MGYPIVLIHGMWCQQEHLARVDELLSARTYDCRRFSLPDHDAGSDQPARVASRSLADYLAATLEFIRAQNFSQPPVLLGHSMGGLIAQMAAPQVHPPALVLLTPASPAGINAIAPRLLPVALPIFARWGFWKKPQAPTLDRYRRYIANNLPREKQDSLFQTLVSESGRAASEIAFWWADRQATTQVPAGELRCPVYAVSAGQDYVTPAAVVRKVAGRYAQSTHRNWPQRGHWVIDDADTEEMVYEIDGWLRPILQRAARPQGRVARG